jgi:hypothetical protein
MVVKLIRLQINKLVGNGFQTPICLVWEGNVLVGKTGSRVEKVSTLCDKENVRVNSENLEEKNEQRKQQQESGLDGINLRRISARQRTVPVTRREDFLW